MAVRPVLRQTFKLSAAAHDGARLSKRFLGLIHVQRRGDTVRVIFLVTEWRRAHVHHFRESLWRRWCSVSIGITLGDEFELILNKLGISGF